MLTCREAGVAAIASVADKTGAPEVRSQARSVLAEVQRSRESVEALLEGTVAPVAVAVTDAEGIRGGREVATFTALRVEADCGPLEGRCEVGYSLLIGDEPWVTGVDALDPRKPKELSPEPVTRPTPVRLSAVVIEDPKLPKMGTLGRSQLRCTGVDLAADVGNRTVSIECTGGNTRVTFQVDVTTRVEGSGAP